MSGRSVRERKLARVARLATGRSADEIAALIGLEADEVADELDRLGRRRPDWIVTCNRTGRTWRARSQRGAYYLVCLHGLVDWECTGTMRGRS